MTKLDILELPQELKSLIAQTTLPERLGFGKTKTPIMVRASFSGDRWSKLQATAYEPLAIDPSAKFIHYGQAIFEGLKCFRNGEHIDLFRPLEHARRFNASAKRMAMPAFSPEMFLSAAATLCYHLAPLIPRGEGESLYVRPVMIATESGLGLAAAKEYLFYAIACPSGAYFSANEVNVLIERRDCRAAPGGTGAAKTAGNYGGSLNSMIKSGALNFQQNLWLDAKTMKNVEELSGMNFFAVIDSELYTPALTDSILPGITRNSIIDLASDMGIKVHETAVNIGDVIAALKTKRCSEIFATGTAAVVTPIASLGEEDGTRYMAPEAFGPIAQKLRSALVGIQRRRAPDSKGWLTEVTG